jgi:NhaP-type Na+/H+ or K+/H+ antiporter
MHGVRNPRTEQDQICWSLGVYRLGLPIAYALLLSDAIGRDSHHVLSAFFLTKTVVLIGTGTICGYWIGWALRWTFRGLLRPGWEEKMSRRRDLFILYGLATAIAVMGAK